MSNFFSKAVLIPVYKHGKACIGVVDSIADYCRANDTKIILVDDGNPSEEKKFIAEIANKYKNLVILLALAENRGKGEAFRIGLLKAKELGFSHILQLDADGQHDSSRIAFFFERAFANPIALICGYPEYDKSAPNHRKGAHKFANWWCGVVTWKRGIVDSLCGFRVYPVKSTAAFYEKHRIDSRMGFDIEILIRLIWQNVPFEFHGVRVTYPADGISNFRAFRDNARISWVFTKLCVGMIFRSPIFFCRKFFTKDISQEEKNG